MRILITVLVLLAPWPAQAGLPERASQIKAEYEAATATWARQLRAAADAETHALIWRNRPDSNAFGARMWAELRGSLKDDWTHEYSAWLLERAPVFAAGVDEGESGTRAQVIMKALERHHLESEKIGLLCLALTSQSDPKTLALVEKVSKANPHKDVQGQAALAIAMLLKGLGEGRDIMIRRLDRLREAIIKANDVKVGDVTVARLAEDEIYVIQNLMKGRIAPDIVGRDAAGTPFKLSQLENKVTVLVFWHSSMRDADRGLDLLRKLHAAHGQKGMQLVGVTSDPLEVLRNLRGDGTVPWRNFSDVSGRITAQYRVRDLPLVYVLGADRKILYIGGPGVFVDAAVEAVLSG